MDYKTLFIVDPFKSERLQLARFLKQEKITIAGYVKLTDCFKKSNPLRSEVIIYVLRKGKTDMKALNKVQNRDKKTPLIILASPDLPEVDLEEWKKRGFRSISLAFSNEKVKEISYNILSPDAPVPERKPQQPVPLP
ncbi:MAG: hypothetical protein GWM98_08005 [Nitrospinaceae bacterium]|nr:hypothetical protein [Nitrospinaceae bacterium]NIR54447.1 hypothetical protein [Nitrospinaceae bacterium]NIS84866.1 hypothetical protein [Nitrospinaceae bacterium]NIT81678.1 hypothetical protein [Nitrospinaceae bacterium]NIU43949.1 hypothetical protein [Nitrospinaceae bacterium]